MFDMILGFFFKYLFQAHSESQVHERLSAVLEVMEKLGTGKSGDRDLMRVNELIKVLAANVLSC